MKSSRREPENAQPGSSAYPPSRTWRVVIAQDGALPAEQLKRTLNQLGHLVVGSAETGVQTIALTRQWKPDVVVMDLQMPLMDGWTAIAELTREGLAPVVVVSALDARQALEQAVPEGASAFLTQPVREDDLDRALELAIARFADAQALRHQIAGAEQKLRELDAATRELQMTKAQLAAAARRAATAGLAHSLTHEINNALTPIIGNAQILALLHAQSAETVERTEQIIEYARRIAGWTALYRELAAESNREAMDFSFHGLARDVFEFYAERFQRLGISLHLDLDAALPALRGNPARLQQVLLLLVQNAIEAMPQGGEISFRTVYDAAEQHVEATLSDSGIGISQEHAARLFEPGFTTKDEATHALAGWGLYTTLQIVQAHGGSIKVVSPATADGRGTTVRLRLPLEMGVVT